MKKALLLASVFLMASAPAFAGGKTYQVTGPVVSMDDKAIVVQKGNEKWEIAKGSAAVPADVKVGSKVTVEYSMTAAKIIAKDAPAKDAKKK